MRAPLLCPRKQDNNFGQDKNPLSTGQSYCSLKLRAPPNFLKEGARVLNMDGAFSFNDLQS